MSIQRRPSGKWRVRYPDPLTHRELTRHFDRKVDAERFETEMKAERLRGRYHDPRLRTTVAEYAQTFVDSRPYRATSRRTIGSMLRRHVAARPFGALRLVAVRQPDVQAWATSLVSEAGLSPLSARTIVNQVGSVFLAAQRGGLIAASPVHDVKLPRVERPRVVPLTGAQVAAIASAMPPRCRVAVLAQAGLGLRVSEMLALRVQDVDLLHRRVRIEFQRHERGGWRVAPKTPRSVRTVPLPAALADELAAHIETYPPLPDGSIFYGEGRTGPLSQSYYHGVFKTAVRIVAAVDPSVPVATTPHALRHAYASTLLATGLSSVDVGDRLGHVGGHLVESLYGHPAADSDERIRAALDAEWNAPWRAASDGKRLFKPVRAVPDPDPGRTATA